jgi:hypothetical protein
MGRVHRVEEYWSNLEEIVVAIWTSKAIHVWALKEERWAVEEASVVLEDTCKEQIVSGNRHVGGTPSEALGYLILEERQRTYLN